MREIQIALLIAMAKDVLDLLVDAGYLVTVGTLAIIGIPLLIILDIFVAIALWFLLSKNWLIVPVFIFEALPVAQTFPTWTLFVLYVIYAKKVKR